MSGTELAYATTRQHHVRGSSLCALLRRAHRRYAGTYRPTGPLRHARYSHSIACLPPYAPAMPCPVPTEHSIPNFVRHWYAMSGTAIA
eukprot:1738488-Rhodomonas_salina.2